MLAVPLYNLLTHDITASSVVVTPFALRLDMLYLRKDVPEMGII